MDEKLRGTACSMADRTSGRTPCSSSTTLQSLQNRRDRFTYDPAKLAQEKEQIEYRLLCEIAANQAGRCMCARPGISAHARHPWFQSQCKPWC
eukprot:scaffold34521_cov22-Tisochrysis_lutea.AAC.1